MNTLIGEKFEYPSNKTILQYFEEGFWRSDEKSRINPKNIALIEEDKYLSFKELLENSSKLAYIIKNTYLKYRYIEPNEDGDYLIGLCIEPSIELIVAIFAILKLGAGYIPFDNRFPENRILDMCKLSKPLLVICDDEKLINEKFNQVTKLTNIITISNLMEEINKFVYKYEKIEQLPNPGVENNAEKIAIVMFTSGSSGQPKGVRISHRSIMNRIYWNWKEFPLRDYKAEKNCLNTTLTFGDSVAEIFGPLLQGRSLTVFSQSIVSNPLLFIQKVDQNKITRLTVTPGFLKAILSTLEILNENDERYFKYLKSVYYWVCSGETLPLELVQKFFKFFPKKIILSNFYGSTEIMGDISYVTFSNDKVEALNSKAIGGKVPLGIPIYNNIIYICDNDLNLIKKRDIGEIYIAGHNLFSGYAGNKGCDKFLINPFSNETGFNLLFKTGDFGHIDTNALGENVLVYNGRQDCQIKVRGQRVDLSEIHSTISSDKEFILDSEILCFKPGEFQQQIVAFVVKNKDTKNEEILQLFHKNLKKYEIPQLQIVNKIPKLISGKTDRQKLLKDYEFNKTNEESFKEWDGLNIHRDKINGCKILVEIVSKLTNTSMKFIAENLDKSFYCVGGNSLNSIVAISSLREKNFFIEIVDFIYSKSLRNIVNILKFQNKPEPNIVSFSKKKENNINYIFEDMNNDHQDDVIKIVSECFSQKGDLEKYNPINYDTYHKLVSSIWDFVIENGYSAIIRRKSDNKIVAALFALDYFNQPSYKSISSKELEYDIELQDFVEKPLSEKLKLNGINKLFHTFLMGASHDLNPRERVTVIEYLSKKIIEKARILDFEAMFALDTSPLTKQLEKVHDWELLLQYQVNRFVNKDGIRPFSKAPDNVTVHVCWKKLK